MAEKLVDDANRMKSRSFLGYVADRAVGRADFTKEKTRIQKMDDAERQAVGYAKGGMVMTPKCTPYKMGK